MSRSRLRAGPYRPGITGATRPGSDFLYDIITLTLNTPPVYSRGAKYEFKNNPQIPIY
jgi:hypothetical protein